ncbi:hypothetical protein AB0J63_21385 [Streptosporangium canum]
MTIDDTHIAVRDEREILKVVTRTTTREVTPIKAKAHTKQRKIV